uniref:Uncharacterized protein n=1 Tax=Yersinia enterocolitica W22703 TaxID=913028 RepID=F4MUQ3_YEREN|nr:unknown protein [Yersinia enterocolitica W22703]
MAQYSPYPEQAHQSAQQLRQEVRELRSHNARSQPLRTFLQFGTQPLFTSSGHTLQSEVISLCGGEIFLLVVAFPGRRSAVNK